MRKFIITALLVGVFGCKTDKKNTDKTIQDPKKSDLHGTWGLTNYFDTIVKNKKIAEYRLQEPTWFAILLDIRNDSIYSYGSIFDGKNHLNIESDTLSIISGMSSEWHLKKKKNVLHLIQTSSDDRTDTTVYIYRKREDLNHWIGDSQRRHKIWDGVTSYFNKEIIAGKYFNKNDTIEFKQNGKVLNFKDFRKYRVNNYFGTLHPFRNLDVICLENDNEISYWNWKINKEKLELIKFGIDKVEPDYYSLTSEKIVLKKH